MSIQIHFLTQLKALQLAINLKTRLLLLIKPNAMRV